MLDPARLAACAQEIAEAGAFFASRGWVPATSGNLSVRATPELVAITASGRDKARLTSEDVLTVTLAGAPTSGSLKPSAETGLHLAMYRASDRIGAVVHTHSHNQTVASRLFARDGAVRLQGYELQKALAGESTHERGIAIPIVKNRQDIAGLACEVAAVVGEAPGYLIEGHGLYTWGRDLAEARRHVEAIDFLLGCELELRRMR